MESDIALELSVVERVLVEAVEAAWRTASIVHDIRPAPLLSILEEHLGEVLAWVSQQVAWECDALDREWREYLALPHPTRAEMQAIAERPEAGDAEIVARAEEIEIARMLRGE